MYRATRNLSIGRRLVRKGQSLDPASVSEAGLQRLLARGYAVWEADAPPVTHVRGIGPERARTLQAMGILTTADLAQADPAAVEQRLTVSPGKVARWQADARAITEGHDEVSCEHCGK